MEKVNFEEALVKLENAVKRLESGNLSLDESLETFEEATGLVKLCNKKLSEAERRVRILTEAEDGSITDESFDKLDSDET